MGVYPMQFTRLKCECGFSTLGGMDEKVTAWRCPDCKRTDRLVEAIERVQGSVDDLYDLMSTR